jgi:Ca-activated chloride channel family protein
MAHYRRTFLVAALASFLIGVRADAQDSGSAAAGNKALRVDIDLVLVNATVTDSQNNLITDLTAGNFQIWEDKVEQKIEYFSTEDAPLSLGIIFDVSHSMEKKIDVAREAAATFLQTGSIEDEYFLVEFSSRARLAEDFTTDISRLRDRLAFAPAEGTTAMYDAVYLGLNKVKSGQNPRKALLLITDGEDNHSRYSRGDIHELARESDVQIYIIDLGRALVGELAEITGGRSYRGSVDDLEDICEKISLELRNQYVLGFASTNLNKDGKWRKLQIRAVPPPGMSRLNVRTRSGYYAPTD